MRRLAGDAGLWQALPQARVLINLLPLTAQTRGLLLPGSFIDAAEETGLIRELGMWTLEAACAQLAAWRTMGIDPGRVAVNVSALQAHDPNLPQAVRAALARHGLQPNDLELELTESTLLSDTEGAMRTVEVHRARVFDKMNVKSAVELANLLREPGR